MGRPGEGFMKAAPRCRPGWLSLCSGLGFPRVWRLTLPARQHPAAEWEREKRGDGREAGLSGGSWREGGQGQRLTENLTSSRVEQGVLWSPPVVLGEAAEEVGEARQGRAQGELSDGGDVEISNVDIALLSQYQIRRCSAGAGSHSKPPHPLPGHGHLHSSIGAQPLWAQHLREGQWLIHPPEPPGGN